MLNKHNLDNTVLIGFYGRYQNKFIDHKHDYMY